MTNRVTNSVIRAHEELIQTYERLGMTDFVNKERDRLAIIKSYYGIRDAQPVQLSIDFQNE